MTGQYPNIVDRTPLIYDRLNSWVARFPSLGKKTEFWFEYGPTEKYGSRTISRYGGLQITPRLAFDTVTDLQPGMVYHYRLVAANETGTSYGKDKVLEAK